MSRSRIVKVIKVFVKVIEVFDKVIELKVKVTQLRIECRIVIDFLLDANNIQISP